MKIPLPADLLIAQYDSVVIKRLKNQINNPINLNRNKEVELATRLAVYWYVTSNQQQAMRLLDSFCGKVEYSGNKSVWFRYCEALMLRMELEGDSDNVLINDYKELIEKQDIIASTRVAYFLSNRMDHREALSLAEIETQKYQCEIYAQEILTLVYYKHMLPLEDTKFANAVKDEIAIGLNLNTKYLSEALKARRKANEHRLPMHKNLDD